MAVVSARRLSAHEDEHVEKAEAARRAIAGGGRVEPVMNADESCVTALRCLL